MSETPEIIEELNSHHTPRNMETSHCRKTSSPNKNITKSMWFSYEKIHS